MKYYMYIIYNTILNIRHHISTSDHFIKRYSYTTPPGHSSMRFFHDSFSAVCCWDVSDVRRIKLYMYYTRFQSYLLQDLAAGLVVGLETAFRRSRTFLDLHSKSIWSGLLHDSHSYCKKNIMFTSELFKMNTHAIYLSYFKEKRYINMYYIYIQNIPTVLKEMLRNDNNNRYIISRVTESS